MKNNDFDERQKIERGKAFQYAFLTGVFILLIIDFLDCVLEVCRFDTHSIFMITFWISSAVFFSISILKDSFSTAGNEKASKIILMFYLLAGCLMLIILIREIISEAEMVDEISNFFIRSGSLNPHISSMVCSLSMLEISVVGIIKNFKDLKSKEK